VPIATGFVAHERVATEPAALVNEAYLRLRKLQHMEWQDRHRFLYVQCQSKARQLGQRCNTGQQCLII
jgi:hypothetical protein